MNMKSLTMQKSCALLVSLAFTACQTPVMRPDVPNPAVDVPQQPPSDADPDAAVDQDVVVPSDNGPGPLTSLNYMPEGCAYQVTNTARSGFIYLRDTSTFGPMPEPRNVHVNFAGPPSTTAVLLWATDFQTRASVIQIGTAMNQLTRTVVGHVASGGTGEDRVTEHEVHVCGLNPATTYYYKVGGEGHWSAVQSFKTAPANADATVNFAVCGDSRDNLVTWQRVQRAILQQSGMSLPDFLVFSGDAVPLGQIQGAWESWFRGAATMSTMPWVMAHGNHDALAINYLLQFAQPQGGDINQSELYFSYDYGPIHLVVLNDTGMGSFIELINTTERNWIEADLMRANANRANVPWIVVAHHKPAFSSAVHSDAADTVQIRMAWPPLFSRYRVDAVFNGHDHHFEMTVPLDGTGNPVAAGEYGTTYVTTAGAGAELYDRSVNRSWTKVIEKVDNFTMVRASRTALRIEGFRVDGAGMPSSIANTCINLSRDMMGATPRVGTCM